MDAAEENDGLDGDLITNSSDVIQDIATDQAPFDPEKEAPPIIDVSRTISINLIKAEQKRIFCSEYARIFKDER